MSKEVIHMRRGAAVAILVVALIAGAFVGTWAVRWAGHQVFGAPMVPVKVAGAVDPVRLGAFANGFASVVQPALPAIVNISTTHVVKVQQGPGFFNDPFFQQFFGNQFGPGQQQPQTEKESSLGSGVIINSDGYILTNNHVVEHGSDIKVQWNNKNYTGKVVGTDPQTDIAVVKIDATGLPTLTFGDSSKLRVGDVVFAIGDPFGIGETATMGIVSATERSLGIEAEEQRRRDTYEDFIQTDAAINPGNSGGALIDLHGNLIGINTAILSSNSSAEGEGGNEGIGFAIPIDMARSVMEQIIQHGKVERGHIGIALTDLQADMAKEFGYTGGGNGALVDSVSPGSPAEKAGIKRGDIILGLNGDSITGSGDLTARIANTPPGTTVHLKLFRAGKTFDVPVTLAPGSAYAGQSTELGPSNNNNNNEGGESPANGAKAMQGVHVENLSPDIAQQLNLPMGTKGVVVDNVDQGSAAAEAGLARGDVIQEVNHKPVTNMTDFRNALAGSGDNPVLLLVIQRSQPGSTIYMLIEPQS
ncbi:MAG: Do family serine endopeptidase [Candidatus Acidiferrales bacterium]